MKEIIQHKSNIFDGSMVAGGTVYTAFSSNIPVIIGVLTAVLFLIRIVIAIQEYRLNKRKLKGE